MNWKSLLSLTAFSILLVVVSYLIKSISEGFIYSNIIYFIIYYYFLSVINLSFINFAIAKNKGNFILYYLASMVVRLFLSFIVAFLFMYIDRDHMVVIGVNFIVLHLLFLGLELFFVITKVKKAIK